MSAEAQQPEDFTEDDAGWQRRWTVELAAAHKEVEKWHASGAKVEAKYRCEEERSEGVRRLPLYTSTQEMQAANLYGQTPRTSVTRRFADAKDDVARVASEMLERLLNTDIERDDDTYAEALGNALMDWLRPGLGLARVRYDMEDEETPGTPAILDEATGQPLAPAVPPGRKKLWECVETDYVHWKDVRWTPGARVWSEVTWLAFGADMPRKALVKRFGKEKGGKAPLNAKRTEGDEKKETPWQRARVWEVWDKDSRATYWVCEGMDEVLDSKEDPYELDGFFPCPKPLRTLVSTSTLLPRPEYVVAEDQYRELDELTTRISRLAKAVKVSGCADSTVASLLERLVNGDENIIVPYENWNALAEKGGLRGVVDWLPLEQIVQALAVLSERRAALKEEIHELTGMADLMRGASSTPGEAATTSAVKARFGSVRLQRKQDEFARFASDLCRMKAQLIAKFYDAATIIEASNVQFTEDAPLAEQAVGLIKSNLSHYRVEVKPESVAMSDFAALQSESMQWVDSLGGFIQRIAPVAQAVPGAAPGLLKLAQTAMARQRGASAFESVFDSLVAAAEKAGSQPQQQAPDPKLQAQAMKGQQDLAKVDKELQADAQRIQLEVQADAQREENQMVFNVREHQAKQAATAAFRPVQPQPKNGGFP